jgi:hypothetical protein
MFLFLNLMLLQFCVGTSGFEEGPGKMKKSTDEQVCRVNGKSDE